MNTLVKRQSGLRCISPHLPKRSYNTLFERQTNFAPLNMDTTGLINIFECLTLCNGLSLSQALIATQVSLKLVHVSIEYILRVGKT